MARKVSIAGLVLLVVIAGVAGCRPVESAPALATAMQHLRAAH